MVYLHISAYKSIIADLRDEIGKLKSQLQSELMVKGSKNPIQKVTGDIHSHDFIEESKNSIISNYLADS